MGGCASKPHLDAPEEEKLQAEAAVDPCKIILEPEPLVVCLISGHKLPALDLLSESDVFVLAHMEDCNGSKLAEARWPVKWDTPNPVWRSCRQFGTTPPPDGAVLVLRLFDYDESGASDFMGTVTTPVSELAYDKELDLPVVLKKASKKAGEAYCKVKRVSAVGMPNKKSVYFIRHGESVWNKAQKDKDALAMLSSVDHPLNDAGRAQAEALQEAKTPCSPPSDAVSFVETCLIGLEPMLTGEAPQRQRHVVALNPNLREKRNFGGKDSSGQWVGNALVNGVRAAISELYKDQPEVAQKLNAIELDLTLTQDKWWVGSAESSSLVADRIAEAFAHIRFNSFSSIVIVGHSHYFREALKHFRASSCILSAADGSELNATQLDSKKLSNAGVIRCELDFSVSPDKPIMAAQLCFETTLVD
ncbi:hypothetical protein AB1Y20_021316 [Prymnesium parvum]|uniref:C2 domain-containing protein n=1 Tax=Prymnesium parvum TaxID=97485 RepID=A0AB34JJC5_PRYPA